MTDQSGTVTYVKALDGVRAASILLVIAGHSLPLGLPQWQLNSVSARSGMALFFCLSGFLITSILWHDQRIQNFLVKRLARIIPAMALYLTVLFVFFGLPLDSYLLNLLFVSNYATHALDYGPVSHLWSLCVELHFYLAIALLVFLLGRRALWLIPVAAVIVTGLRIEAGATSNINTHLRVDEILAGGILALTTIHKGDTIRAWLSDTRVALGAVLIIGLLLLASAHNATGPLMYLRPYFSMLLVGTLMHCRLWMLHDVLESRPAAYIARISYALYIWHKLPLSGFMDTGSLAERYLVKRPVSFVLMWILAHLSTFMWETRWQKAARQYLTKANPKPA